MPNVEMTIREGCVAAVRAPKRMLGKDVEASRSYLLAPSSAQFAVDADTFRFSGTDMKAGRVRADIRTEDVRSIFINVQKVNVAKIVWGIVLIAGGGTLLAMWFLIVGFFVGPVLVIIGIVLLVKGLNRAIEFTILVTQNLFNFVTISLRSMTASSEIEHFIDSFWNLVRGTMDAEPEGMVEPMDAEPEGMVEPLMSAPLTDVIEEKSYVDDKQRPPTLQSALIEEQVAAPAIATVPRPLTTARQMVVTPRQAPAPVKPQPIPAEEPPLVFADPRSIRIESQPIVPSTTPAPERPVISIKPQPAVVEKPSPVFTCNVCYEQFSSQQILLEHKRESEHW